MTGKRDRDRQGVRDEVHEGLPASFASWAARLMVDHEVGVQRKVEYRVYRIDDDFFETTD